MLGALLGYAVAAILVASAALKIAAPTASVAALQTFGLRRAALRRVAFGALVVAELGVAIGLLLDERLAGYAGAALLTAFALALAVALRRGRAGAPCGCFGARSRVSRGAVARSLLLAGALALAPSLSGLSPSADGWLALGLGVALIAVAALTVAVLALARELGTLRLALGSQAALEIPQEGPAVGERVDLGIAGVTLAVFSSQGCPLCRQLEPALEYVARDPRISMRVFDEERDAAVWAALAIPGSPYAVALTSDATVLAKGTFNSLAQLESVLATARSREGEGILRAAA